MRRQRKWWSKSSGTCSEPIIRTLSSLLPALLDLRVAHFYYHCLCILTSLRTFVVWGFGLCDDVRRLKSQFPFCSLSFCHTPFQTSGCSTSFRMSATRALAASIARCSHMCAKPFWPAANQIEQIHLEMELFQHWKVVFQKRSWRSSGLLSFHYNYYTIHVINTHCIISQQCIEIDIYLHMLHTY